MSVKDENFYSLCPICGDKLIGTDDGFEVYSVLIESFLMSPQEIVLFPDGPTTFGCGLCGESVSREKAREIVDHGPPVLYNADGSLTPPEIVKEIRGDDI